MRTFSDSSSTDYFCQLQELVSLGKVEEALPLLENFVLFNPHNFDALRSIGYCLFSIDKPEDALKYLSLALVINPRDTQSLGLIGQCLVRLKKLVEAADVFRHAISIDKKCANSRNNLGMLLLDLARPHEALPHFKKAIELNPSHEKACVNLIKLLLGEKEYERAHEIIEELYPNNNTSQDFLTVCCDLYFQAEKFECSEYFALELVNKFPSQAGYHKLSRSLLQQHKHSEFVRCTLDISKRYPDNPSNIIHATTALLDNGEQDLSFELLAQELEREPDSIEANIAQAYNFLRNMDLVKGWEAYEHRLRLIPGQIHFNQKPNWDGSSLINRKVLVLAEQGIGDVVLYSRFLNHLLVEADKIYILCDPRSRCLLEANFPQLTCLSDPTLLTILDYQVSIALASLAKIYAIDISQIQSFYEPYIAANENLKTCWRSLLQHRIPAETPKIGISLNAGIDHYNRLKRSCPFSSFLDMWPSKLIPMIDLDHHREAFHEDRDAMAQSNEIDLISFDGVTSNLDHLCALISQLDLVITTQQTNAHLCGAMGIPCIVMLPQGAHFIYGNNGSSTVWYPSLYLIRLTKWHQWNSLSKALQHQIRILLPNFFKS
ncbi:tetratricopeptide repeat protein [Marinomonas shanghaiensis]|uniref:tetratricopeptide repeat protein n=1 Tax=Marinomonas shanghaiensis TaxID=2202418 RepID=UPI003A8CE4BB